MDAAAVLQTFSLSKYFGDFAAVQDVNLQVRRGEIVGLLGPNGAGKSTTIKMLSTLLRPSAGTAQLLGWDILQHPYRVRQQIGIIFQDASLDNRLTGRENLEFHCMVYKVPKNERAARIKHVLEMVDLSDVADRFVKLYSGGMKRRLEIARGLLHRPAILFLDEPTVGLDPQTRATIWEYVRHLVQQYGMGVLMTTHYMEEAEHCHYIAIIDRGRIIAQGSPAQLKTLAADGDQIYLETADNTAALAWLRDTHGLSASASGAGLKFALPQGDTRLGRVLADFPQEIQRIKIHQPTLEDVFLNLTGRQIRGEESDAHDRLKVAAQRRGKL